MKNSDFLFAFYALIEMNSFCRCLRSFLSQKSKVEVDVYLKKKKKKKKKLVHMSFLKPLISYSFFEELIFCRELLEKKERFFIQGIVSFIQS